MCSYSIETYNKRRNFNLTDEPAGVTGKKSKRKNLAYVVQKHAASRLHYDFRLEMGGVLKSWAVPKGPSKNPKDKRLAVRTEDHPLSYGSFEGIIPKNHYGAGSVMLWDNGVWEAETNDPLKSLAEGKINFQLYGEKLHGRWSLVRMLKDKNKSAENWLLIKNTDNHSDASAKDFLKQTDKSVKSGRSLLKIAADESITPEALQKKYPSMQLATLVDTPPSSAAWLHEVKYDGYRIMAFVNDKEVTIRTRGGHNWTSKFPALKTALAQVNAGTFVIDGEVVVLNEQGVSSFQALQVALREDNGELKAYFFDLLYWNNTDYSDMPLLKRKQSLNKLSRSFKTPGPLFLSDIIQGDAGSIITQACKLGLEGIISKSTDAVYQPGRSKTWLKSKCTKRQEFIITGFVPASNDSQCIGALHLGYYKSNKLVYAGKVGTGFDHTESVMLYRKLKKIARSSSAISTQSANNYKSTVWVDPEILCEVKFAEWTTDGKIRHASYQGLRMDKSPEEIGVERPMKIKKPDVHAVKGVNITNPQRIIFPEAGVTKSDLADFYAEFAEIILADLVNRPITVVRCPGGITKQCFYQRGKETLPEHIYKVDLNHKGKKHDYIVVKEITGLLELVQMGVIEIHPWGSKIDRIEYPDRIIFDLDPSPEVPFEAVKLAATDVRQRFDELGLESFLRTTGGKGIHVIIPVQRKHTWEVIKTFASNFARTMVVDTPTVYVSTMSKKKREGKIFIDYFRNNYSATAVMNYCVRARPGAPVAVPLFWKELDTLNKPDQFDIKAVRNRKKEALKLGQQYQKCRQSLMQSQLKKFL